MVSMSRSAPAGAVEDQPVVGAGAFTVLQLGLGDGGLEVDVPQRGRLGGVGLAPCQEAQESPSGRPGGPLRRSSCSAGSSRPRGPGAGTALRSLARPRPRGVRTARRNSAGETATACRSLARPPSAGGREAGLVGQRRVAADAVVVLDPALGGQPVVVPAHRVEDLVAAHPLVAGDGVGVGEREDVADVQRPADRRGRRVDRVDLLPSARRGRSGRCRPSSQRAAHLASRPSSDGFSGTGDRHDPATVLACCASTTPH